jgi:hypothetical protein
MTVSKEQMDDSRLAVEPVQALEGRKFTVKHGKQHYVTKSYLEAWCDPEMPQGHEPYVWVFSKDGSNPRRKAPENIFHERDFYTIKEADGSRCSSYQNIIS